MINGAFVFTGAVVTCLKLNLLTITEAILKKREIPTPHPGTILREEFLGPMDISVYALAKAIHVPRSRLNEICRGNQRISAGIALRLARFFGVDPQWFLNMQSKFDLAEAQDALSAELGAIVPRAAA